MSPLLLMLVLQAASPAMGADDLLAAADAYVQAGQYKKASPVLQKVLATPGITPVQKAKALCGLGMVKSSNGDAAGAVKLFEESIATSPDDERAYLWLGMTHDTSEHFQEARSAYDRGVARFPRSASLLRELGATELLLGDAVSAVDHLGKALKTQSEDPELMRDYGEALLVTGKAADAVKVLEDARQLDGENAHIAATLGDALAGAGRVEDAIKSYDDAVQLDRNHAPAWFHRGLLLAKKEDLPGAAASYRNALRADPANLRARLALGVVLTRVTGKEAEAVTLLKQVVDKEPSFAEAHLQLGLALEKTGDLDAAQAALQEAVNRKPEDQRALHELARLLDKRGKKKEAAQLLKQAGKEGAQGGGK